MKTKNRIKIKNIKNNVYYKDNPKYFLELINIINKNQTHLTKILYAKGRKRNGYFWKYEKLVKWIKNITPKLNNSNINIVTRIYWIINNIKDFPKCYVCRNIDFLKNKNVNGLIRGYSQHRTDGIIYCSHKCSMESRITKEQYHQTLLIRYNDKNYNNRQKCKQTCLKRFGAISNLQTSEMHKYYGKPYVYDNIKFSSQPELAYYIWLKDNKYKFEYEPMYPIYTYKFKGEIHRYFPDFNVNGQLVEIKGSHLVDQHGIWVADPRYKSIYSKEKFNLLNQQMKVKQKYVLSLNTKILYTNDYKQYLKYVDKKYGKNYLRKFKQL